MTVLINILLILSLMAVLIVLFVGIFSMIKGGEFNKKYGNKLMRLRVLFQGIAILLLALTFYLSQN